MNLDRIICFKIAWPGGLFYHNMVTDFGEGIAAFVAIQKQGK